MLKILKNIYLNYYLIIILIIAFLGKFIDLFLLSYVCSIIHEVSHIILVKIFKIKIQRINLLPFGITAKLETSVLSPNIEILISLAGPFSNILMTFLIFTLNKFIHINEIYFNYLFYINILCFILNLLPIVPLDGGRILRAHLAKTWGILKSYNFLIKISFFLSLGLIFISTFFLLFSAFNFSLLLIGVFLIGNLTIEERNVNLVFMKEILNSSNKLSKNNINKTKIIAVFENLSAIKILKYFTYNNYYIITVIDENMKIINTLTESEIISSILSKGAKIKCGQI